MLQAESKALKLVDFSGTWLLVLDEFAVFQAHRQRLELASTHQIFDACILFAASHRSL